MDGGAEDSPLLRGDKRLPTTEDGRACGKRVRPHRRWRAKAGVLGAVMFALAFAGLVAIFNVIQSTRTPRDSNSSLAEVGKRGQGAGSGQPTDSLDGGFEVPPQGARGMLSCLFERVRDSCLHSEAVSPLYSSAVTSNVSFAPCTR